MFSKNSSRESKKYMIKLYRRFLRQNQDVNDAIPVVADIFPYSHSNLKQKSPTDGENYAELSFKHRFMARTQAGQKRFMTEKEFKQEHEQQYVYQMGDNYYIHKKTIAGYDVDQLDINRSKQDIIQTFNDTGIIQLRNISDEEILIIGCGNKPLTDDGGTPIYEKNSEYQDEHRHEKAVTMDPDLSKNPTFVMFFGKQELNKILNEHRFKKIIIEGVGFNEEVIPYLLSILDKEGVVEIQEDPNEISYQFTYKQLEERHIPEIKEAFNFGT